MRISLRTIAVLWAWAAALPALASELTLSGVLEIPGDATDSFVGGTGLQQNRLGGFGSDLVYHWPSETYFGLVDSGPARGLASRAPRIQQFSLEVDPDTGEIGDFELQNTLLLRTADGSETFDGLNPWLKAGDASALGLSLDPEGLVVAPNGNFYVADEYGPSLYEFAPFAVGETLEARFVRALSIPANLQPTDSRGLVNYVAERESNPPLVRGRQDNRGFEGVAISPDGNRLFAALQAPLSEEGDGNQGRYSRNVRIVEFDVASGVSTAQYIHQLEDLASINARVSHDFADRRQGRRIGISAIRSIDDYRLLVVERDNRGVGTENPVNADPEAADVGVKRLYEIDILGATDVSNLSLAGTNALPADVRPVSKSLVLDIHGALSEAGLSTPEKIEGLTVGPQLDNGDYALLLAADNDSSALLTDNGELLDVYTDGSTGPVDGEPLGRSLLPSYIYSFRGPVSGYTRLEPKPVTLFAGDADQDLNFDQMDLVKVQLAAKYLTGQAATWGDGDWNGAPGGRPGSPPLGDGLFDQLDVIAALTAGIYLAGPYHASINGQTVDPALFVEDAERPPDVHAVGADPLVPVPPIQVPEPSSIVLLAAGLLCLAWILHRPNAHGNRRVPPLARPAAGASTGNL